MDSLINVTLIVLYTIKLVMVVTVLIVLLIVMEQTVKGVKRTFIYAKMAIVSVVDAIPLAQDHYNATLKVVASVNQAFRETNAIDVKQITTTLDHMGANRVTATREEVKITLLPATPRQVFASVRRTLKVVIVANVSRDSSILTLTINLVVLLAFAMVIHPSVLVPLVIQLSQQLVTSISIKKSGLLLIVMASQ